MRKPLVLLFILILILNLMLALPDLISPASAGQVITDDDRQWAHKAIEQEASLALKPSDNAVAVLYFHNRTRQSELDFLQMGMAVMLISDLAKVKEIQVVERARLQALAQELEMGTSGLVAEDSAPRVGRLLGARYLVGGDLNNAPQKTLSIDSNVLSVPKGSALGSPSSSGPLAMMLRMEKDILFEIIRLLHIELTEAQKKELHKPFTSSVKALMYLIKGIQSSDQGAYDKAADYYRLALQQDPELEPAKSAIKELGALRLIRPAPPAGKAMLRNLRKRVSVNRSLIPDQITKRRYSEPASALGPAGTNAADVLIQW